jgi:hypothetical protein
MQSRAIFVVAFLLFSSAAALAESRPVCQSMPRAHASWCDAAVLPGTLRSEGPFAQAFARSPYRLRAPLCTSAGTITASANARAVSINHSTRHQWASSR